MRDFSIERAIEQVQQAKTKNYLREVYSCYANGNYRSAIVGLWSVAVCDMLFKLEELETVHKDNIARKILEDIKKKQSQNPKSPDWETELLNRVASDTELLDVADKIHLEQLHEQRHLAAHPVITGLYELHSPSQETVRAFLRSTLEGLLLKPAVLSRKIFDAFVEDLERHQNLFLTNADLRRYLTDKYLARISPIVESKIFHSLWKLAFRIDDPRCEANRNINVRALSVVYDRRPAECSEIIASDPAYYSAIKGTVSILNNLIEFIALRPEIWRMLAPAATTLIEGHAKTNAGSYTLSWFMKSDLSTHLDDLVRNADSNSSFYNALGVDHQALGILGKKIAAPDLHAKIHQLGITMYRRSSSFSIADRTFATCILPYINAWSQVMFEDFANAVESNSQTWARKRAPQDHQQVKSKYASRFPTATFPLPQTEEAAATFG